MKSIIPKYTIRTAIKTKNPKTLINILRKGKNDCISFYAAINSNCPKEMLIEVLKRKKDDLVSRGAAQNPNCSKEILVEVLRRRKNNGVSSWAARNPNCPPEILAEVLKRGKDDEISFYAARNPNCPDEAKIKWMYSTGKIEKENPKKHIIEYENNKEDDFQDLKELL